LAILLQACGMKKTSEVYQIHSNPADDICISLDMWQSGRKLGLAGCAGNFTITGEPGGRVLVEFDIDGIWQSVVDESLPTWSPSTQKCYMNKGGTFTLASNAIKIGSWSLKSGNTVVPRRDVAASSGVAHYYITDMNPTFECDPEADLVANYDYHGIFAAGTTAAVSLSVNNGTDKCTIALPSVQIMSKNEADRDGLLVHEYNGVCLHTSNGNDAVALTFATV
jgi:hypothetical protein